MDWKPLLLSVAPALFISGCVSSDQVELPPPRPLAAAYPSIDPQTPDNAETNQPVANPTGPLTLSDALAAALMHNPELHAFAYEIRMADAHALQAGLWPNPELSLSVDEYNRDGAGFDSAETSIVLSQQFELGGQRRKRAHVAAVQGEMAGWEYEQKRIDLFTETTLAFIDVMAATRHLKNAEELVELAEKSAEAVQERVNVGKEVPLQAIRTTAEAELARLQKIEAESRLKTSRKHLASMWGAQTVHFEAVSGNFDDVLPSLPKRDLLQQYLDQNPELQRHKAERRYHAASLSLEQALSVPDLEASIGMTSFEEDGTDAVTLGIGMPLPLFNRNQGNISAAKYRLAQAEVGQRAIKNRLASRLDREYGALSRSHQRVLILQTKMIPTMQKAYEVAHEGYRAGEFNVLDMLDAQRSLIKHREELVDALAEYHIALASIQQLIGTHIEEVTEHTLENVE